MTKKPKPKRPAARFRNAGPPSPAGRRPPRSSTEDPKEAPKETPLGRLVFTVGSAVGGSLVGALAARYRLLSPQNVAIIMTAGGGALLLYKNATPRARSIASGALSAGGSQLVVQALVSAPPPPVPVKPVAVSQTQSAPGRSNADIGALPPGALDAAFERARSELALTSSAYDPAAAEFAA